MFTYFGSSFFGTAYFGGGYFGPLSGSSPLVIGDYQSIALN
jgi:hypothetical protein